MAKLTPKGSDVGVIIGRFQVDDIHDGHKELIDSVIERHNRVIFFIGLSAMKCTFGNPLDFHSRFLMLNDRYPQSTILYIKDTESDQEWSDNLDRQIKNVIGPGQSACLYGSRDSFINRYYGKYQTQEMSQVSYISGTEIRKNLSVKSGGDKRFRGGAIWAMTNQWIGPKMTIDVALMNDRNTILLGRKKDEVKFRLVGGFVETGETLGETVIRETKEESGTTVNNPQYVDSFVVDDWRYRYEKEKITTALFVAKYSGRPVPGSDIFELKLFTLNEDLLDEVVENHKILIQALLDWRANNN